jgi:hypothetical protein
MSALFDFQSFLSVVLLFICTCTYYKLIYPGGLVQSPGYGFDGVGMGGLCLRALRAARCVLCAALAACVVAYSALCFPPKTPPPPKKQQVQGPVLESGPDRGAAKPVGVAGVHRDGPVDLIWLVIGGAAAAAGAVFGPPHTPTALLVLCIIYDPFLTTLREQQVFFFFH